MSLLKNLIPIKDVKSFEINAYQEDIDIFLQALSFLQAKFKGSGKFTQESLFEYLTNTLRQDNDLIKYIETSPKKRARVRSKPSDEAKNKEMQ